MLSPWQIAARIALSFLVSVKRIDRAPRVTVVNPDQRAGFVRCYGDWGYPAECPFEGI